MVIRDKSFAIISSFKCHSVLFRRASMTSWTGIIFTFLVLYYSRNRRSLLFHFCGLYLKICNRPPLHRTNSIHSSATGQVSCLISLVYKSHDFLFLFLSRYLKYLFLLQIASSSGSFNILYKGQSLVVVPLKKQLLAY